jgi:hypothetical protein
MKEKLILFSVLLMLLTSCGSYQLSTHNHTPEYIGDVRVDVIDNEMELSRKLRFDDKFRWDFAQYAMRQDMRWNYDFYWNSRMYRRGPFASPSDFYWNSQSFWWNWASNSPFNMGFNYWDPFGFNNNYGMGWSYSWNNRRWSSNQWGNPYGWNNYYGWNNGFYNRYRGTNVAYHTGRRSSTMSNRDRIGQASMIESTKRRTNRTIVNKTKSRRNFVIEENDNVDKEAIKLKRNNPNIRIIRNPNNVIIRNNNNKPVRNYNRPENNNRNSNNNIRNNNSRPNRNYNRPNTRPVRVNTPAPTRRSTPTTTNSRGGKPTKQR